MLILGILFCSIILFLYYYVTNKHNYWKVRNVKGPKPSILFGNFKQSILKKRAIPHTMTKIYNDYRSEPYVGMYRTITPLLMIKDLDIIKHIMIKDFDMFEDRGIPANKKDLGVNLFAADGETWRVLRHHFTPLFTTGRMKNMLHLITERGDRFLDHVDTITQKKPEQKVHELIQLYTVSTITACAFGLDIDVINNNDSKFLNTLRKIDKLVFTKKYLLELVLAFPKFFDLFNFSPLSKQLTSFFKNLVATVVTERNGKPTNRNDFMDLLLDMKNKGDVSGPKRTKESKELSLEITEDIMASQAFIFYVAGYETSATTMTFMLYELAKNPHVQEKLLAEIDEVLGKSNGEITYDTLSLPYMEKVFDETLRKYPVADPLQRRAKCNYQIPGTNFTIEKGQMVIVPVTAIHYDETIYPEPELFDPERFDPKVSGQRHSCAYLPFGVGPRNCIGMRFAKVQSRVCMLKLLSRFRVEKSESKEMTLDTTRVIAGPHIGFELRFISRNNKKAQ